MPFPRPTAKFMHGAAIGLAVGAATLELVALTDDVPGDTISVDTRTLFHVDTPVGRAAWIVGWGVFSSWFVVHISKVTPLQPGN